MMSLVEWLPLALVGVTFTILGCLKVFGFLLGIQGGRDKPFAQQLCGT